MKKCATKPRAVQRGVERSGVTTAGNGGRSDPQNVGLRGRRLGWADGGSSETQGLFLVIPCWRSRKVCMTEIV